MTLKSGSDAQACLRSIYQQCVEFAPSILLLDPLQEIAAENPTKHINRSDVDNALLSELHSIFEDAKKSGVTVIGITTRTETVLTRVARSFEETIELFVPSQQDRVRYFKYIFEKTSMVTWRQKIEKEEEEEGEEEDGEQEWMERLCEFLSLHSYVNDRE